MILYVKGDLLQSPAQVLVNTVNTVGVMGRGIALEFKRLYPKMFREYRELCEQGRLQIGMLWLYKSPNKWVLSFPTKKHWQSPSQVDYIEAGLRKFVSSYTDLGIHSIAFPALGCGNGQLDFETQIQPLMDQYLRNLPIEVFIYPGQKPKFVEHLKPKQMKKWLRSEPTNLPYVEVWDDLVEVLSRKHNFRTIAKSSPFEAYQSQDPPGIRICAANQTYLVNNETLMDFWQQLRTHGFSMRQIAPGIDRQTSYLISIFAELDYVQPVQVADRYENFRNAAVIGLQVLPSAFNRELIKYEQPSLFQLDQYTWLPSNQMPVK